MRHDFFKTIDTEEKAYWLGFSIADGCITKNNNCSTYRLVYTQTGEDERHLNKLQKAIDSNYVILHRTDNNKRYKKPINQSKLRISSKEMIQDLQNLGFQERKTGNEFLPEIPEHLKKHLIRGYIDGDGWIRKKRGLLGFCSGSKQVVEYICDHLNKTIGVTFKVIDESRKYNSTVYNCNLNKKAESLKAIYYLYDKATVYLDRKMEVVKEALELNNYCPPT